jgi:tetratricopeptide (TPR) repeat protein
MLLPNPGWMSIDMRVPFVASLWEPKYVLGALAFFLYGVSMLFWLLRGGRRGLIGFAFLAPLLLFAVEFSAVRIQEPFVLYRSYLWMPPLFLLLPAISCRLPNKIFWPSLLLAALAFAYATNDRLKSFSDGFAMWDDAVQKLPDEQALGSARAHSSRGYGNAMRGELGAALGDFERALRVDPEYRDAYQNRMWVYRKLGDSQAALRDADALIRLYPNEPKFHALRGGIYREMGDFDRAIADFAHACDQGSTGACLALALTRQQQATARTP